MPRKNLPNTVIRFEMPRKIALELGLLTCTCGHPENNHFDWKLEPCAHCECKEYTEIPRAGKLV